MATYQAHITALIVDKSRGKIQAKVFKQGAVPYSRPRTKTFTLWDATDDSAYDRITFSMWMSIIQRAMNDQRGLTLKTIGNSSMIGEIRSHANAPSRFIKKIELGLQPING